MKQIVMIVLLGIGIVACSPSGNKQTLIPETEREKTVSTDQGMVKPSESDTVYIRITDGRGSAEILKKERQVVYVAFDSEEYHKMNGILSSPDSIANIRFLQIFMPDSTMDGPFSRTMAYDLPLKGRYTISIGENMMAGDPWGGIVNVSIELQ